MAQRLEICKQFIGQGKPKNKILIYASVASSTWYSQKNKVVTDCRKSNNGRPVPGYTVNSDGKIIPDQEIAGALVNYRNRPEFAYGGGYTKLTHYLRRDYSYQVNRKKVYRLCSEHNLLLPKLKKRYKSKSKRCSSATITQPNRLWELDLKYGYIHGEQRVFFIMSIIDVFTRLVVGYHLGLRCCGKDIVFTLNDAIEKYHDYKNQLIIRSDNGTQMTSHAFINNIENYNEYEVIHELIPVAPPNMNAHIESFNSILEVEFLQPRFFKTYASAYEQTVDFMNYYNTERIHGSLNYRTPLEVYNLYKQGLPLNIKEVRV